MNKISKFFICLCLLFASCFAMVGCGNNNDPGAKNEWTNTTISSTNFSNYLDLSSYLYYDCANLNYDFNMPCADYCSTFGTVPNEYLNTSKTSDDFYKKTTKYFFNAPDEVENKRWKIIEFTTKTDIRIKNIEFDITRKENSIINTYNISFIINNKTYTTNNSENNGDHCKFTFNQFWFENYEDIKENSYLYAPKDTKITIIFNDIKLIKETYSKEQSDKNGNASPNYSTDEERTFASKQSAKCFNIGNFSFNCDVL